jgi:nucleotide-binding universal stress UspA family protein
LGAWLHIITVDDGNPGHLKEDLPTGSRSTTYGKTGQLIADLGSLGDMAGLVVEVHGATGSPSDSIIHVAENEGVDLIVVANVGMRSVERALGSVPSSLAHHFHCSVLIVGPVGDVDNVDGA